MNAPYRIAMLNPELISRTLTRQPALGDLSWLGIVWVQGIQAGA